MSSKTKAREIPTWASKRELFAANILAGLYANPNMVGDANSMAAMAVEAADELLKRLHDTESA